MKFYAGDRVILKAFEDNPMEYGMVMADGPVNGIVTVSVIAKLDPEDDGIVEVPVEQVVLIRRRTPEQF